ncbi:protein DPCD [Neodiprion pinetum]|uniref:Protein DPCD n=1 Tax=Neodiprion lecontei TaxID=441921 RepID=A0A6J0C0D5_NEOLC|nr:protein DPCD [Neodiprion lecontei]XP_046432413.1 protein DPCD [Neodiprion fabricii]XP_046489119.1 protein DPCD [Neodiprion pinetum]XP_046626204.1 protein DPCD [Neodiprion virginianus]
MAAEQWLKAVQEAKKTAIIQDGKRKVHFMMGDGKEMVEEYHLDTNVLTRRAWREKGKLGQDVGWAVEVGDPDPKPLDNLEVSGIRESSNTPIISRRITKVSLEWRIRNLPYPKDVYSVTAENDKTITVRTSNKKYFKKISVPDLERVGLKPEQERISFTHQFNTLIITYKKPPLLIDLEKTILQEILQLKTRKESDVQCPTS